MLAGVGEFVVLGLVVGGIYALFSTGLSLIFGVLDVINVAHGEFFTIGGYLAFAGIVLLGLPPLLGVPLAALGAFALGLAVYPLLIAPMKRRLGRRPQGALFLVLTLGLSTFLQNGLLAVAGGDYLRVPPYVGGVVDLGFIALSNQRALILVAAVMALVGFFLFLRMHRQGRAMRAVAMNPEAAQAVGIDLGRTFTLSIAIGVGLAGLAGALIAPLLNVYPAVGFTLTIKAFAIVILGGLGNLLGALLASFGVAIVESLSVMVIPTEWQPIIAFCAMILVLIVRPQGLLGTATRA